MPSYQIELFWRCPITTCATLVKGRYRTCPGCGYLRTKREGDIYPSDITEKNAVSDPGLLKQARAGADWHCPYCKTMQSALKGRCTSCGSFVGDGSTTGSADVPTKKDERGREIIEGAVITGTESLLRHVESSETPEARDADRAEHDPFGVHGPAYRAAPPPEPARFRPPSPPPALKEDGESLPNGVPKPLPETHVVAAAGTVLALLGLGLFFYWLLHTRVVTVAVESARWERVVHVERYASRPHDGFDPPLDATDVTSLGERVHHHDHVLVGSHTERYTERVACGEDCTTPSCYTTPRNCTSNKNGFASCTGGDRVCPSPTCVKRYCNEPRTRTVDDYEDRAVYRPYYAWRRWEWAHERDVTSAGPYELPVSWPSTDALKPLRALGTGESEREEGREEHFETVFVGEGDRWTYNPSSEEEFKTLAPKSAHRLAVNHAGAVRVLRPGEAP